MTETVSTPTRDQSSQRLFLLIGALWLILGGVILSQLPSAVPTYIKVNWETETETDTAGFNIYRTEAQEESCEGLDDESYQQVNNSLITSLGNAIEGESYSFRDDNIDRDQTYCYKLEDVELNGTTERHDAIVGSAPRQIDRILYIILAPLSFIVGISLIYTGLKRERKL